VRRLELAPQRLVQPFRRERHRRERPRTAASTSMYLPSRICSVIEQRESTPREVNGIFTEEAASERCRGVVGVITDPIVSSDIIGDARASVIDLGMTQVVDGDLIKIMSWYDNEWDYSSRILREAARIASAIDRPGLTA
jgi:glyceraldehyde 3-phosphate dehydrogenase